MTEHRHWCAPLWKPDARRPIEQMLTTLAESPRLNNPARGDGRYTRQVVMAQELIEIRGGKSGVFRRASR